MANLQFPTAQEQKVASIWNSYQALTAEGSVYYASNPTPSTGLLGTICVDDAATASSTHAQFAPFLLLTNGWSSANPSAKTIYPLAIKVTTTVIPVNSTAWEATIRLDSVTSKYSSGGTALSPLNANTNFGNTSGATIYGGAIIPTGVMSTAGRLVMRHKLSNVIPIFGDTYTFSFGDYGMDTNMLEGGATARAITIPCASISVAPGWCMQLDMFGAGSLTTAGQWEVEIIYAER